MEFPSGTPRWRRYLRFWRPNARQDIDDEIRFHFEARIDELVAAGNSPEAARAAAREEFGDVDTARDALRAIDDRIGRRRSRAEWLESVWQDTSYALRSLRRAPGLTFTVVLTLALGLGVNSAIFSFLNSIFLRPPAGVVQPETVRRLWWEIKFTSGAQFWSGFAYPNYESVVAAVGDRAQTALYSYVSSVRLGRGERAPRVQLSYTTASYFPVLGARPALGRFYSPDEDRLGTPSNLAVVSHAFWERALDADSSILGRSITAGGVAYTVIGVAAKGFAGVDIDAVDLWAPLSAMPMNPARPWWRGTDRNGFQLIMRRSPDFGDGELESRASGALHRQGLTRTAKDSMAVVRVGSIIKARGPGKRAQEVEIGTRVAGVTLIVLLIAGANVINLLLGRAVRRRREIAVRLALGISRARLIRLLVTESLLLSFAAGAAAIFCAYWGGLLLRSQLLPDVHWADSVLDWRVVVFAAAATCVAGVLSGLVPALQSASPDLANALKAGAREGSPQRSRLRSALVVVQAALSVMLLVGAALFVKSLGNVRDLDLGFDAQRLIFAHVNFETKDPARDSTVLGRLGVVAQQTRGLPGVEATALTGHRPMYSFSMNDYFPDAVNTATKKPMGMYWAVSPDYFAATGIRVLRGQGFSTQRGAAMPPSVIVNEPMARALWPGVDPIGRCVRFETADARCNTVVAVVENAHWGSVIEESTPQFYLPLDNMPFPYARGGELAVRAGANDVQRVSRDIDRALRAAFPGGEPVIIPMASALVPQYRPWRLGAALFASLGVLALIVAAVGMYSTVSYAVAQRTHEFGVRAALGATMSDVLAQVLSEGLRTVAVGVAVGIVLALAAGRLISTLLYGIQPSNPIVIGLVALMLLAVATLAALAPAWRAARVDPVTALRAD